MPTTITTKSTTDHPGMYANSRHLARSRTGVLWAVVGNRAASRLEFWFSTNDGASWTEDTSQRLSDPSVGFGFSLRIRSKGNGTERLAVAYRSSSTNKINVAFGLMASNGRSFSWHSTSPKRVGKNRNSDNFRRPDLDIYWLGEHDTWVVPVVWSELTSAGKAILWMSRARFVRGGAYTNDEVNVHDRFSMSTFPRPSCAIRHLGSSDRPYNASPDLFLGWCQGIDVDPTDRGYMMRLTLAGADWQTGQLRVVEENGDNTGLTALCYTGQRAAFVQVPSDDTESIVLHLMQPSDSSRSTLEVPALEQGELTSLAVTWDDYTADIYVIAVGDTVTGDGTPYYIVYDWASRTFGSWAQVTTDTPLSDTVTAKPGSAFGAIEILYAVDVGGTSTSFRHALVATTNVPPDADTWDTSSGAADVAEDLVLAWTFNDTDGDAQANYELTRVVDDGSAEWWNGSSWQGTQSQPSSASTSVTVTAATPWGVDGEIHAYTVRSSDGQEWGPWSDPLIVIASTPVNPTLDAPTAGTFTEPTVTAEWTVAEQSAYRVRLLDGSSDELTDSGWLGSSTVRSYEIPHTLVDAASYTVEVTTKNAEGLASDAATAAITADLTPAPTPTWTYGTDAAAGSITLDIDNGTPGGGEAAADSNNVYRIDLDDDDAVEQVLAVGQTVDTVFHDRTAASGRNYSYAVEAITEAGAATKAAHTSS